ncbi:uncharacterized protein LOC119660769 [Hermetia illucens]|uniref:uncharacterized protein LOC119660769 n=1 Tax=Hermetia illucens TaxID=343691 RepID=UPI0018CBFC8E|nr:uncharacterized protein LOC119660769 [Hermetia illucens]
MTLDLKRESCRASFCCRFSPVDDILQQISLKVLCNKRGCTTRWKRNHVQQGFRQVQSIQVLKKKLTLKAFLNQFSPYPKAILRAPFNRGRKRRTKPILTDQATMEQFANEQAVGRKKKQNSNTAAKKKRPSTKKSL